MATGLKVDIESRPPGPVARGPKGQNLGMFLSGLPVVALPDNLAVANHHRSHHGIGGHRVPPLLREHEGPLHPPAIGRLTRGSAHPLSRSFRESETRRSRWPKTERRPERMARSA